MTSLLSHRNRSEHDEQVDLFNWAAERTGLFPELDLLYAVPNAARRSLRAGARAKAEGLKAGVPDVALPCKVGSWGGLYIELKTLKGRVSDVQKAWLQKLVRGGQYAVVCRGAEEAKAVIVKYLSGHYG